MGSNGGRAEGSRAINRGGISGAVAKLIGGKNQQSTSNTLNGTENQLKSLIQRLDWKFEQVLKQIPFSSGCADKFANSHKVCENHTQALIQQLDWKFEQVLRLISLASGGRAP